MTLKPSIVPWAKVKEHTFENLIALCPTDHARAEKDEIDRQSLLTYKRNLGLVASRYGEMERRVLDLLARDSGNGVFQTNTAMDFEFMYLIEDGILTSTPSSAHMSIGGTVVAGVWTYMLTEKGFDFIHRWRDGLPVE